MLSYWPLFVLFTSSFVSFLILEVRAQLDANDFCFSCIDLGGNNKNFWPVAEDCHQFYHCFYLNSTYATGVIQTCPPGTFYHDEILGCLPEGPFPCKDACRDDEVEAHGCYGVPGKCTTFYVCSNTASYPFCCPKGTSFNESSCSCDTDSSCTDECTILAPPKSAAALKPVVVSADSCQDSYDNTLFPDPTDNSYFYVSDGTTKFRMSCAPGSSFELEACQCNRSVEVTSAMPAGTQCDAYLPFDTDFEDYSINKFYTQPTIDVAIDRTIFARGGGSLRLPGGKAGVAIPGMKTFDFGKSLSICFFYKCAGSSCVRNGSLLANTNNNPTTANCTLDLASLVGNTFLANLSFDRPLGSLTVQGPIDASAGTTSGFTHICIIYDGSKLQLYINSALYSLTDVSTKGQHLQISHCSMNIGYGSQFRGFAGYIDEVVICRGALSANEVDAHFTGYKTMNTIGMVP